MILISGMDTFFNRGEDTCSTKAKHELIITSEREDGVIQFLWRNYRSFDEAIHTQTRLYIFTLIAYFNDRMADGKLEILAYVRVEAHDVNILNGLNLSWFVVEIRIASVRPPQRTLLHYGPPCIVNLTFPVDLH